MISTEEVIRIYEKMYKEDVFSVKSLNGQRAILKFIKREIDEVLSKILSDVIHNRSKPESTQIRLGTLYMKQAAFNRVKHLVDEMVHEAYPYG